MNFTHLAQRVKKTKKETDPLASGYHTPTQLTHPSLGAGCHGDRESMAMQCRLLPAAGSLSDRRTEGRRCF